jgi:RNA recognition motif-containing protein
MFYMTKLFVVGFPRNMDEIQLAQLFGPYGDIDLLTIVRDKFNGESKGFGFIQMKNPEGASLAIEALDGHPFGDRKMEVRIAVDKEEPAKRPAVIQRKPATYLPKSDHTYVKKKRPRLSK